MYTVLTNITIQQISSEQFPNRNLQLVIPFLHSYEAESSWEELTQTLKLTLPKNVKIKAIDPSNPTNNKWVNLKNVNSAYSNLGGFLPGLTPVLLRGDLITLNVGYRNNINSREYTYMTGSDLSQSGGISIPPLFKGYIASIEPKLPFTIKCEDNMWLLKQIPTPIRQWGNLSVQDIITQVMATAASQAILKRYAPYGVNLSVSTFSKTNLIFNVKNFITRRESLAALMSRIKHQYKMDSYFRGNELRIGLLHYVPSDAVNNTFTFQQNIVSDKLIWKRRDDVNLSMVVKSHYRELAEGTTKDGQEKTKAKCVEILIYNTGGANGVFTYESKTTDSDFPNASTINAIGEKHDFNVFSNITDPKQLFNMGVAQLKKYYYDGFRGSFTAFGVPYVKHGDIVTLVDNVLKERGGTYQVKKVIYFGGCDEGLRQEIHLDYKI